MHSHTIIGLAFFFFKRGMLSNLVFSYETKYELSLITYLLLIYVVVFFFSETSGPNGNSDYARILLGM